MQIDKQTIDDILACTSDSRRFDQFKSETQAAGYCQYPVLLSSGCKTVMKGCGNRRRSVCLPCSDRYKNDMWHLVSAGLRGGKGVPETVGNHPMVFVTLTAPSFGAVHSARAQNGVSRVCRPDAGRCRHGRLKGCWQRHDVGEGCLGKPLCLECFRYEQAVIFNALAPELWRRTTIYIKRALARVKGVPQYVLDRQVQFSYVKVAEYQKRGVIHFHAIIRLDEARTDGMVCPPQGCTTGQLVQAVREGVKAVRVPSLDSEGKQVCWGSQLDIQPITKHGELSKKAAGYIAKYATKATETVGLPTHNITEHGLHNLALHPHVKRYLQAAGMLAKRLEVKNTCLRRVVQTLGFSGHCTTKSRRYSTTLTRLRAARATYKREGTSAPVQPTNWMYVGHRQFTVGQQLLMATAYQRLLQQRTVAKEELVGWQVRQ